MVQGEKGGLSYLEEQGGVLMDCLMIICRAHSMSVSRVSLLSGLPLDNGELSPTGFERAAQRAGLTSRTAKRDIAQINPALLPAVLIMEGKQACVLHELRDECAKVSYPELDSAVVSVELDKIASQFTGYVIFARPVSQTQTQTGKVEKKRSWSLALVISKSCL